MDSRGAPSLSSVAYTLAGPVLLLSSSSLNSTEFFAGAQQVYHLLNEGSEPEKWVSAVGIQKPETEPSTLLGCN